MEVLVIQYLDSVGLYPIRPADRQGPEWKKRMVLQILMERYGEMRVVDSDGSLVDIRHVLETVFDDCQQSESEADHFWYDIELPSIIEFNQDDLAFTTLCDEVCQKHGWTITHGR